MEQKHGYKIELLFDREADGYFHVHSPDVPGLHLAGMNLADICADIPIVVRNLLLRNKSVVAEDVQWLPSLADIQKRFPEREKETYFVSVKDAA